VFGLTPGEFGGVAGELPLSRRGKGRHADQVEVDEQGLAGDERVTDRGQVDGVPRSAEEPIGDPELRRGRSPVSPRELEMVEFSGVGALEHGFDRGSRSHPTPRGIREHSPRSHRGFARRA
jgi:hypothetical protein